MPSTNSLLPDWSGTATVQRLRAFDTLVICHFTFGVNQEQTNECRFRIAGADALSNTLSLTAPQSEAVASYIHVGISIAGAVDSESAFTLTVAAPGTSSLQNTMTPTILWDSFQDYYPSDVIMQKNYGPVASTAASMGEMTATSPPDAISRRFNLGLTNGQQPLEVTRFPFLTKRRTCHFCLTCWPDRNLNAHRIFMCVGWSVITVHQLLVLGFNRVRQYQRNLSFKSRC